MKITISITFVLLIVIKTNLLCTDGVFIKSHFNDSIGTTFFKIQDLAFAERFKIDSIIKINQIKIGLSGKKDDNIVLRIYGNEGNAPIPVIEENLLPPLKIKKTNDGDTNISIKFENSIKVYPNQFFVVLEDLDKETYLKSDLTPKQMNCIDGNSEYYSNQLIKSRLDGKWKYANFSFDISIDYTYDDQDYKNIFQKVDDFKYDLKNHQDPINLIVHDFNGDSLDDIMAEGIILLNNGMFKFKQCIPIEDMIEVNYIIDYDFNRISLLVVRIDTTTNKKYLGIIENFKYNKSNQIIDLIELNDFHLNNYLTKDLNDDGIGDLILSSIGGGNVNINQDYFIISKKTETLEWEVFSYQNQDSSDLTKYLDNLELFDNSYFLTKSNSKKSIEDLRIDLFNKKLYPYNLYEFEPDPNQYSNGLYSVDLNNDGYNEIISIDELLYREITNNEDYPKYIYKTNENSSINDLKIKFHDSFKSIILGDINDDNFMDLITLTDNECQSSNLLFNHEGKIEQAYNTGFSRQHLGYDGILVDLDNNGLNDLITLNNNNILLFENTLPKNNKSIQIKNSKSLKDFQETRLMLNNGREIRNNNNKSRLIQPPFYIKFNKNNDFISDSIFKLRDSQKQIFTKINDKIDFGKIDDFAKINNINTNINDNWSIYPNPFDDIIYIDIKNNFKTAYLELYDSKGNYQFGKKIITNLEKIDISTFKRIISSGFYQYKLQIDEEIYLGKLIRNK